MATQTITVSSEKREHNWEDLHLGSVDGTNKALKFKSSLKKKWAGKISWNITSSVTTGLFNLIIDF